MSLLPAKAMRGALALGALAAVLAATTPAASQNPDGKLSQPAASEAGGYRRVFVLEDRPDDWPTAGQQYLPIDREEFERLVQSAGEARELAAAGGAQLERAHYAAKLNDDFSLSGQATFDVKLIDQRPRVLKLSPWNAIVTGARWMGVDEQEKEALLGAWAGLDGRAAEFGVLVERAGKLTVDWLAPANSSSSTDFEFQLQLPRAVRQEFVIDLPPDCSASMTPGQLVASVAREAASGTRWTFHLGGAETYRLHVSRSTAGAPRDMSLPLAAAAEAYSVTPRGLDYEAEFRIQPRSSTTRELRLTVPDNLRVTDVLLEREPVEWRNEESNAGEMVVALPKSELPISVIIRGVGAVVFDELWQLPSITAERVFWTEGTSTLWIDPALELKSITPRAASLLNLVGVGGVDGGEAYRLQAWSSDAATEVMVAEREPRLHAVSRVIAEFSDRELGGRCDVRLWATGGPLLHAEAMLEPEWILESVEATPADALAQWHVAGEGRQRRLHLQLRRPPTRSQPIQLAIAARKPLRGWSPVATLGELDWIRFPGVEANQALLLVKDRRGNELLAERPALAAIIPADSLTAGERQFVGESPKGLLFAAEQIRRDATVRVVSTPARLNAEAWMELTHTDSGFQHRAEIVCRPVAGFVSELVVTTARALPTDAQWVLVRTGEEQPVEVQATRRPPNAAAAEVSAEYRVRLPQPLGDAFRLRVVWRGDNQTAESINSFALPGAESWQSWAILRGNPALVHADPRGCAPAASAPDAHEPGDSSIIVGCYRLGDDPVTPIASTPMLTIVDPASVRGDRHNVTCWSSEVTTLQFADGSQTHRVVYELEAHAADAIGITAPEGLEVVSVRVNGASITLPREAARIGQLQIPLPNDQREIAMTVDFQGRRHPLEATARIAAPLMATTFPVLQGRWTVASPPPFQVENERERQASAGWRQRLFGPLMDTPRDAPPRFLGMSAMKSKASRSGATARRTPQSPGGIEIPRGWSSATQEFVSAPAPMDIRRADHARALWHVFWLFSAAAAGWLWPVRPRWVVATAAAAAISCLVLPMTWIVLPQSLLLGAIAGAALREVLLRTQWRAPSPASVRATAAALLTPMLIAALFAQPPARADDSAASPPAVLYPIDAQGRSAGRDVYAPTQLLSELMPAPLKSRYDGAAWALLGARYEVQLGQDQVRSEVACHGCVLQFRLQTFRRNVQVDLPLNKQEAAWVDEGHSLDGVPVKLVWNSSGPGCFLVISDPGVHNLEVNLIPTWTRSASQHELRVHVPPLAGAAVEVIHPAGLEAISMGSAAAVSSGVQPTRSEGRLPPTDVLEVSWPNRVRSASGGLSVDQLAWLEIDPAAARLNVRLRITGNAPSLETIRLATPPQLKLLPLAEDSSVAELQTHPGSPNVIELKFRAPPQLPITIPLEFQVQRSVSLGHIDFPSVRVLDADVGSRHFAVRVDNRLRLHEETPVGLAPVPLAEVERLWGPTDFTPTVQYVASVAEPAWSMHIEPAPARFTSRETLELLCQADDARISYTAAIGDVDGDILIHRLTVPRAVDVTDVTASLVAQGNQIAVRWSRPQPDQVCVFLSRPLSEAHTLRVAGRMRYAEGQRLSVPRIGLESTTASPIVVNVRRTSDVLVQWSDDAEAPPPAMSMLSSAGGLPVGQYAVARNADRIPQLQVASNDARFSADALLTLNLRPAEPVGALLLHGRVSSGIVDRMRFLVSKNWRGPLIADPSAEVNVLPSPREADRQAIEVRLEKPLAAGSEFDLKLTGAVALETDQRVRFPNVRVLDATEQRVFLTLPQTPSNQTAEWTIRGLDRETLPETLTTALGQSPRGPTYRVERERFVAEQRVFPDALRKATVRLAATRAALDVDGPWSAVTQMIVQPGGASSVEVKLPTGAELLHAAVDDHAVVRPEIRNGRWQLPPGSRYLPRVVVVAYRQTEVRGGSRFELQLPQALVEGRPLDVARSLWQIEGDPAANLVIDGPGMGLSPQGFRTAARREEISAVLDASPLAFQLPEWELKHWFRPWLRRIDGRQADSAEASSLTQDSAWANLREQIAAADAGPSEVGVGNSALDEGFAFDAASRSAFYQGAPEGQLTLNRASNGIGAGRWLLALALAGMWGVAWRRPEKIEPLLGFVRRWPAALGIAAGCLWWMMLSPRFVGPAIIAISLAALLKRRQLHSDDALKRA